jgi:hypothetical protein
MRLARAELRDSKQGRSEERSGIGCIIIAIASGAACGSAGLPVLDMIEVSDCCRVCALPLAHEHMMQPVGSYDVTDRPKAINRDFKFTG